MLELLQTIMRSFLFFFLHLGQSGSFPKALSPEKEKELLKKMKDGDKNARSKLIEHNLRLVAHIIKKYYSTCADREDLVSIGTLGLIKAIDSFDCEKGAKLATYASRCIENEILMYFRTKKKNSCVMSFNDPIDVDSEGNPLTLIDVICTDNTIIEDIDQSKNTRLLYELIDKISDEREKTIIIMRYGLFGNEALTQSEIAKKMKISRSYVSRIEKKVIEGLREGFGK